MNASDRITIKEASSWASELMGKKITASNISYLIQYGRIRRFSENGSTLVSKDELSRYYKSVYKSRKDEWRQILGDDLNWTLSFEQYKESQTTKHVHRLHPYKGKFIPQLVEYFLDTHTDKFKKEVYFQPGDIVLDPFAGSGTTLVQANELGLHSIGVDVSAFNVMITACKLQKYDYIELQKQIKHITLVLEEHLQSTNALEFEQRLLQELSDFNSKYFPSPDYKYWVKNKQIDEKQYAAEKEKMFLPIYEDLLLKYQIKLLNDNPQNFLDKWFIHPIREEIDIVFEQIRKVEDVNAKRLLALILSRTIRSCRATTHADLATLIEPMTTTYYCRKHGKICKPLFSMLKWWKTYTKDTIKRLQQFDKLRKNTLQACIADDSRTVDLISKIQEFNPTFAQMVHQQKIKGIFTSPPYVGLIDYHEQHAYAYDLFGFERKDELEVGPLYKGQGLEAQESYVQGVSEVLLNSKKYLQEDYDVFLVSNDKYNLYPTIAKKAGMKIVDRFKRPVLNRTEKDKNAYSEIIFHLKEDDSLENK